MIHLTQFNDVPVPDEHKEILGVCFNSHCVLSVRYLNIGITYSPNCHGKLTNCNAACAIINLLGDNNYNSSVSSSMRFFNLLTTFTRKPGNGIPIRSRFSKMEINSLIINQTVTISPKQ